MQNNQQEDLKSWAREQVQKGREKAAGVRSRFDQLKLEAGDRGSGHDAMRLSKMIMQQDKAGNTSKRLAFDIQKIAGNSAGGLHDDLANDFLKSDKSVEKALDTKARASARNKTAAQRRFGSRIGSEDWKLTQPTRGGGVKNMYAFKNFESFVSAGATDHLSRAATFAAGRGVRADLMNSLGFLTKHQKNILASTTAGKMDKFSAGMGAYLGAALVLNGSMDYLVGDKESTLTDNAATNAIGMGLSLAGGTYAFRTTKELTHAATSLIGTGSLGIKAGGKLGWLGKVLGAGKLLVGTGAGIGAFAAASTAIDAGVDIFKSAANNENAASRLKKTIYSGDTTVDASIRTNQLLTSRQRAMSKLAKSSLNDRGYVMGNEAMILKGIYQ
jgi:hypothetical protein|nr:MAG TPA: hypothetical protein [Caudoviricetes sp.]